MPKACRPSIAGQRPASYISGTNPIRHAVGLRRGHGALTQGVARALPWAGMSDAVGVLGLRLPRSPFCRWVIPNVAFENDAALKKSGDLRCPVRRSVSVQIELTSMVTVLLVPQRVSPTKPN